MIKALRVLVGLFGLLVIVAFAIANRVPVEVSFAPLPIVIELPVYGVFLLGLVVGGLLGGIAVWLGSARYRRQARRLRRRTSALESQVSVLKKQEQTARAEGYPAERAVLAHRATG
jgi:lipopolysaccharide assembly protein A